MAGRTWSASLLVVAFLAGCGRSPVAGPPGFCPTGVHDPALAAVDVRRARGRPNLALVVREGDPRPGVVALVVTGGDSHAATALAALLEARVVKAGFPLVDTRADRDSLRVRTLAETPERGGAFVAAVRAALADPVVAGSAELALVAKRLMSLKRHPFDAPVMASVAQCTGELGVFAGDPTLEIGTAEGIADLEATRAQAYAAARVAFGVVGTPAAVESVTSAIGDGADWPAGDVIGQPPSPDDAISAFASATRGSGTARITLAVSTKRAETAVAAARSMGDVEAALATRLRALAVPYRVVDVGGTARPHGGCLAVTLEMTRPALSMNVEDHAALATAVARQEIERALGTSEEGLLVASPLPLGYEGGRAVRAASDPREAAELAALWSITAPASREGESSAVALALPPPNLDPREPNGDLAAHMQAASARFSSALERAEKAWGKAVLEHRDRVERGQGELWILLASPCGLQSEGESDAGLTALTLMTALGERAHRRSDVTLEPWISPDGVGVVAHAARLAGESPGALTERVAEEAARTLAAPAFSPAAFAGARSSLLQRVGEGTSAEGRAEDALARAVSPGHPSWLAPLGSWDDLLKAGIETAGLRRAALADGPLRLAVLANEDPQQGEAAARTIDRWLVRASDQPRACPVPQVPIAAKAGVIQVTLASSATQAQALLGFPVAPQGTLEGPFAELTLAALNGPDGWLAKALGSATLGASARARLVGGSASSALIIDIRATDSTLEAAVAQVRGLLERLRQGAIASSDVGRATALREKWDLEASLDPRHRLVDLWRGLEPGVRSALSPSLDSWRAFVADVLKDEKLVIVLARPKR